MPTKSKSESIPVEQTILKAVLTSLNPTRVFQWGLYPTAVLASAHPSVQYMQIVASKSMPVTTPVKLENHTTVSHRSWAEGYHVMHITMGMELYDLTVVEEEFVARTDGRDPERARAREAFARCVYGARSMTKHSGLVVAVGRRGWDRRMLQEAWRWSYGHRVGEVWLLSEDKGTLAEARAAVERVMAPAQLVTT